MGLRRLRLTSLNDLGRFAGWDPLAVWCLTGLLGWGLLGVGAAVL